MSPSEMPPTLPADTSAPAPSPRRRRLRLGAIGAGLAAVVIVALFAALTLRQGAGGGLGADPNAPTPPAGWQTYRDPAGLFSVRLPPGWTAQLTTGQSTFGDRTGSATETDEMGSFSDPAQGQAGPRLYVSAAPINTDFERHLYCQGFPSNDHSATFHGIPAEHMNDATWLFETANAHFQLDVWIPGVVEPVHSSPLQLTPIPTSTPVPPATAAADRALIATVLGSFQPSNAAPLACS